jgi:cytochrome P450
MIVAGTSTTGLTLTYLFFELARHPAWYARLRAEVCIAAAGDSTACSTIAAFGKNLDGSTCAENASERAAHQQQPQPSQPSRNVRRRS